MGSPSAIVKAVVPYQMQNDFNLYNDVFDAIMAGALLNFDLPPAYSTDTPRVIDQKAGWGSISQIGGMVAPYKAGLTGGGSLKFQNSFLAKAAIRRLANQVASALYKSPKSTSLLAEIWVKNSPNGGRSPMSITNVILGTPTGSFPALTNSTRAGAGSEDGLSITWGFPDYNLGDIAGGFGSSVKDKIDEYLSLESNYNDGVVTFKGPYPSFPTRVHSKTKNTTINIEITPDERRSLAQFLGICLASLGASTSYLHWYSVTIGDLFPAFIPFIFDFEQFILALLKAVESFMKLIMAIIRTLIQKIQQLEQILEAIIALLDLLNVSVRVSVLGYTNPDGSVDDLVSALSASEDKPSDSPYGLHSGIVLTTGGPAIALKGLKALGLLMGIDF